MIFIEKETKTVKGLLKEIESIGENYIFRGQKEGWPLQTSLQRTNVNKQWPEGDSVTFLLKSINESKDQFKELKKRSVKRPNDLLSLLQHYKLPTNFLDFSKSPIIALYFAFSQALLSSPDIEELYCSKNFFCIYAINVFSLYPQNANIIRNNLTVLQSKNNKAYDALITELNTDAKKYPIESILLGKRTDLLIDNKYLNIRNSYEDSDDYTSVVFTVDNFKQNKRSLSQQSIFLTQSSYEGKMHDHLESYSDLGYKFLIPHTQVLEIFKHLNKINVNPWTLSPDLEGFLMNEWFKFLYNVERDRQSIRMFVPREQKPQP